MSNFINLSRGVSKFNGGEYDGFVIVKLDWSIKDKILAADSNVVRERAGYCQIKSVGVNEGQETGYLLVTMLGGRIDGIEMTHAAPPEDLKDLVELKFSQPEVDAYLEAVQDTNPIHRGEGAIVPGGMIIAALQDKVAETKAWFTEPEAKFTAHFIAPVDVGEKFKIGQNKAGLWVHTERLGECIKITKKI